MAAKRSLEKSDDVSEKKKFKLNDENISPQGRQTVFGICRKCNAIML